jgi:hypothetical protein
VATQTDRRFRRAHVKPARRRRNWRALVKALAIGTALGGALIYGVYRTTAVAAQAHVLQIEKITVRGNERLSKGEVLAVLNGLRGESLVWTDLDRWRRRRRPGARCRVALAAVDGRGRVSSGSRSASGASTRHAGRRAGRGHRSVQAHADLDLPIITDVGGAGRPVR